MKVPRFKLRSLLIAVAILALIFGGGILYQRRSFHLAQAQMYRANEASVQAHLAVNGPGTKDFNYYVRVVREFRELKLKHERAATVFSPADAAE